MLQEVLPPTVALKLIVFLEFLWYTVSAHKLDTIRMNLIELYCIQRSLLQSIRQLRTHKCICRPPENIMDYNLQNVAKNASSLWLMMIKPALNQFFGHSISGCHRRLHCFQYKHDGKERVEAAVWVDDAVVELLQICCLRLTCHLGNHRNHAAGNIQELILLVSGFSGLLHLFTSSEQM